MSKDIWIALVRYCSYQERCKSDVVKKMQQLEVPPAEFGNWIAKLQAENFLNELRFTKGFVNGRFKNKGWGVGKLKRELAARKIEESIIQQVLAEEIDSESYEQKALWVAEKKWKSIKGKTTMERQLKLQKFLLGKGFEFAVVKELIKKNFQQ